MQRPRKRLRFENVLMVVPLLLLACTCIASLTDNSASKAAKIVVRHKIVSISHQLQKSCRESSFREWKRPKGLLGLAVNWLDRLRSRTAFLKVCHRFLPLLHSNSVLVLFLVLCEVSVHVFVHVRVQAKNSNGTTVRTFSNFNLLCGCCTLLPFPSTLTSLCAPRIMVMHHMFSSVVVRHLAINTYCTTGGQVYSA